MSIAAQIVKGLLENDPIHPSDLVDPKKFVMHRPKPNSIKIYGRRWFRRGVGGTYFKFYVYIDDRLVHTSSLCSGYGDYYLELAVQWLEDEGYIPPRPKYPNGRELPCMWMRHLGIPFEYSAIDVKRQKDT